MIKNCNGKHTDFQPNEQEWFCPKCGLNNDKFVIDEIEDGADDNCLLVHEGDEINCGNCDWSSYGRVVTKLMKKKYDIHTCPTCKGKGVVPK